MIVTNFDNADRYYGLSETIKICVDFAKNNDLKNFENGSYDVSDGIRVNINDFQCSDKPKYEGHKKMIDIQLDLTGHETCYAADIKCGKCLVPYNDEKDVAWYEVDPKPTFAEIKMDTETLVVLFPEDIHSPTIFDGVKKVKKAIFKISVDKF